MPTPSAGIIQLLAIFSLAFTAPTLANGLVLLYGTILAPGRRTVSAALRVMGLGTGRSWSNYHRVLNRARWSMWVVSKLLFGLILEHLVAEGPVILLVDETLERRKGEQIRYKGWFRDAVRSTARYVNKSLGLRWIVLAVLAPVPWSGRPWALPFLAFPALGPTTSAKLEKRHRTIVEWTVILLERVRRWQPQRALVVVGDGSYAAHHLLLFCQRHNHPITLVSRLRLDAALYDDPAPQPPSKRGPKPKKGAKQPSLEQRLADPQTQWSPLDVQWYGGRPKQIEYLTGRARWYTPGFDPAPIRWVLIRCPQHSFPPTALFSSDHAASAAQIIDWFIGRWNIEVTFEEVRAHLGFQTQRQWSDQAIERTTPCLLGLFRLVTLMAKVLFPRALPLRHASWYVKAQATFADALAAVRRDLWGFDNCGRSPDSDDQRLIPTPLWQALVDLAAYSS
jgi:hypothetical protein